MHLIKYKNLNFMECYLYDCFSTTSNYSFSPDNNFTDCFDYTCVRYKEKTHIGFKGKTPVSGSA